MQQRTQVKHTSIDAHTQTHTHTHTHIHTHRLVLTHMETNTDSHRMAELLAHVNTPTAVEKRGMGVACTVQEPIRA